MFLLNCRRCSIRLRHSCGGNASRSWRSNRHSAFSTTPAGLAEQRVEFGECLLDRIEVGAIWGQKHQPPARSRQAGLSICATSPSALTARTATRCSAPAALGSADPGGTDAVFGGDSGGRHPGVTVGGHVNMPRFSGARRTRFARTRGASDGSWRKPSLALRTSTIRLRQARARVLARSGQESQAPAARS